MPTGINGLLWYFLLSYCDTHSPSVWDYIMLHNYKGQSQTAEVWASQYIYTLLYIFMYFVYVLYTVYTYCIPCFRILCICIVYCICECSITLSIQSFTISCQVLQCINRFVVCDLRGTGAHYIFNCVLLSCNTFFWLDKFENL